MQTVDTYLASGDKRVWNYIDADSFASWLLVRDILGQGDPVGSNIYFFMRSSGSKVEMGPMWDFDSVFEFTEHWSAQHDADFLPFAKLMKDPVFVQAYTGKWISVVKGLEGGLTGSLNSLNAEQGKALDDACTRDNNVWKRNSKNFTQESADVRAYLRKQLPWINARIAEMTGAAPAPAPASEAAAAASTTGATTAATAATTGTTASTGATAATTGSATATQ